MITKRQISMALLGACFLSPSGFCAEEGGGTGGGTSGGRTSPVGGLYTGSSKEFEAIWAKVEDQVAAWKGRPPQPPSPPEKFFDPCTDEGVAKRLQDLIEGNYRPGYTSFIRFIIASMDDREWSKVLGRFKALNIELTHHTHYQDILCKIQDVSDVDWPILEKQLKEKYKQRE